MYSLTFNFLPGKVAEYVFLLGVAGAPGVGFGGAVFINPDLMISISVL
ncbi:MAG: hypothetical protein IPK46_03085 [Saprospiraceae bacterium]|nr:hypothetical protein [Saprospiraceae bacterium]